MTRMGERRSKLQKALSALLVVLMLLGVVMPGVSLLAYADNSGRILSSGWDDIVIAVPETVYMTPQNNYNTTTTSVKYYVNNTVDSSGGVTLDKVNNATAGKFYIYSKYISSITSVSVSGASLSGLSATKSGNLFSDTSFTMSLTSGISSSQTSTLEWSITCAMTDDTSATFYAYTIAYAPYLSPIFAAGKCKNTRGSNSFGSGMSWVSGIHGISTAGRYYPYNNFLPVYDSTHPTQGNGTTSPDSWFNDGQQCGLPTAGGWYTTKEYGYNYGDETLCVFERSAEGYINVDTSRYTNLNQIPNLTCGLYVTDNEGAGTVWGYVGKLTNASDRITSGRNWYTRSTTNPSEYTASCTIFAGDQWTSRGRNWAIRGQTINTAVPSGWIYIRGALGTDGNGDRCFCILDNYLNVIQADKSSWRNAIKDAQKYGFQSGWFTNASDFNNWKSYLKSVAEAVGNPTTTSCDKVSNLTGQTDTLRTEYAGNNAAQVNDLAYVKVLSSTGVFSNEWKVIAIPNATNPRETEAIRAGYALTLKSTTYTGFTYKGNLLTKNQKAANTTFTNANPATGLGLISTDANVVYAHITQTKITDKEHQCTFYYQGNDVTVTINPNGGAWNGSTANSTVTGSYKTEWTPAEPTRTGYTFAGWTHTAGTGSAYSNGTFTFGQTTATLTANWTPKNYTITYDANGGSTVSQATVACGAALPSATTTKEGYTFSSWSYAKASDNTAYNGTTMPAYDLTATANWTANTYTVSFNGNGATDGSTADQAFVYGTAQNLNANGFSKTATVTYVNNNGTANTTDTANFTFANWLGSPRLISDTTEYGHNNTSGSAYYDIKEWTISAPFAADEVYHLEFDAKGSGVVSNYFYGDSGYWPVGTCVETDGTTYSHSDGSVSQALTSTYQHYTVTWTLASSGNANVNKYVLFRAQSGSSVTFKNVVFWKETGATSYSNGQNVNNLCTTSGAVYQMRAQWTPGSVTLPTPTYAGYVFDGWYTDAELTAKIDGSTYTPTEDTTLYAKWTKVAENDLFILQNNRPTTLNVTGNDAGGRAATITSVTGGAGFTVAPTADNKKVVFTPGGEMNDAVSFTYTAACGNASGEATVTVVPATNIYYEENGFITFAPDSKWAHAGTEYSGVFQEGQRPGESGSPMGAYESTEQGKIETTFSMGDARYVTVKKGDTGATATFTFTGTGFDFYAATTNRAGLAFVDIYQYNPDHADADADGYVNIESTMVNTYFGYEFGSLYLDENDNVTLTETEWPIWLTNDTGSDTFFINGTSRGTKTPFDGAVQATGWVATKSDTEDGLYQVPVISRTMDEYGTYKVVIEPRYSARQDMTGEGEYKFYVDAVRIYNPVAQENITGEVLNAYTADKELDVTYQSVRSLLIAPGNGSTAGVAFLDLNGAADSIDLAKYEDIGPKNEVYLMNNQAISFTMSASSTPAKLCIGLKMVRGSSGTVQINNNNAKPVTITGMTDIYHDITDLVTWENNSCSITVTNTSGANIVISVTKLKWSYDTETTASANQMSFSFTPQNLVTAKAVARSLQAEQTEPETVTPDTPTTPTAPQLPQFDNGRRMLTLQALLEQIFSRFFEALRTAFFKK